MKDPRFIAALSGSSRCGFFGSDEDHLVLFLNDEGNRRIFTGILCLSDGKMAYSLERGDRVSVVSNEKESVLKQGKDEFSLQRGDRIILKDEGPKAAKDGCLLCLEYGGEDKDEANMEKVFEANVDRLHEVLAFAEEAMEAHGADMKAMMAVTLSLEELFVNIAHYAYPDGKGDAKVSLDFDDDSVEVTLTDSGIDFDPLQNIDPDIHAELEQRDIGGLGIFMVKKYMDECRYRRENGKNIFTMRKVIRK